MMSAKSFHVRIIVLSIVVSISAALLVGKLFYVQIVHAGNYKDRADHQYAQAPSSATARGTIYLTEKDGLLIGGAVDEMGYKLAINPTLIKDAEATYQALNTIVPIEHSLYTTKAQKVSDPYEEIAFKLDKNEADRITALKLPGVSIFKSKWRFYPGETLASHTLGFVAYKDDAITGRYGLEYMYNDVLAKESPELYVNFFAQIFSSISKGLFEGDQADGNLVTTIEPNVQRYFDDALKELDTTWSADQVGGIIIDPKSGEIIAMASTPDFDLNSFQNVENSGVYSNPNVESVFEFGSVVKPLVMAAAINEGVVTPETTYTDLGSVTVDKKVIYNFDKKARGLTTMQGVLNESLNTGMVFVEGELGRDHQRDYLYKYGFGAKTGIDLPNETRGLTDNLKSPVNLSTPLLHSAKVLPLHQCKQCGPSLYLRMLACERFHM
jgi:cell division protein FtsI/penicillin-binding protein 2